MGTPFARNWLPTQERVCDVVFAPVPGDPFRGDLFPLPLDFKPFPGDFGPVEGDLQDDLDRSVLILKLPCNIVRSYRRVDLEDVVEERDFGS